MEQNKTAGYHQLLYFAKWFVMIFAAIDLITLFGHELSQARIIDQCIAAMKVVLLAASIFNHEKKAGLCNVIKLSRC